MNTKSCIFTSGEATSENTAFGVHEWNKNQSYTEKIKYPLYHNVPSSDQMF